MASTTHAGLLTRKQTAAIVFGAQAWPKVPTLNGGASFLRSANDIRKYITGPNGLAIQKKNVLWLFDSNLPASAQIQKIEDFLTDCKNTMTAEGVNLTDIFVYFVGHGTFPESTNELYLLTRDSDTVRWDTTCIPTRAVARRIRLAAPFARQFVVLDCCYSGAANWMSDPAPTLRLSLAGDLPSAGAVLICSSSSDTVSKAPAGAQHTMFTGAILQALTGGNSALGTSLSARDVKDLAWEAIQRTWQGGGTGPVRPIVISFDRGLGDLGGHGAFPNPAFANAPAALSIDSSATSDNARNDGASSRGAASKRPRLNLMIALTTVTMMLAVGYVAFVFLGKAYDAEERRVAAEKSLAELQKLVTASAAADEKRPTEAEKPPASGKITLKGSNHPLLSEMFGRKETPARSNTFVRFPPSQLLPDGKIANPSTLDFVSQGYQRKGFKQLAITYTANNAYPSELAQVEKLALALKAAFAERGIPDRDISIQPMSAAQRDCPGCDSKEARVDVELVR